jgi:hypothetical protein
MTDYTWWQFQMNLTKTSETNPDLFIMPIKSGISGSVYSGLIGGSTISASPFDYTPFTVDGLHSTIQFAGNRSIDAWNTYMQTATGNSSKAINIGDCFRLYFFDYTTEICHSNLFQRVAVDCYLTRLRYLGTDNQFGFTYQDGTGIENDIEFNLLLRDPHTVSDAKSYTRSDGQIVKVYERKDEQYIIETDTVPYWWLKGVDIALSHDTVQVQNELVISYDPIHPVNGIIKTEEMKYEYAKEVNLHRLVKGSCKVKNTNPISLINNNCR